MMGCQSELKPQFMRYFLRDRFGSKSLMLWLDFILILFSQLRMLARGLIISRLLVQVRTVPKHRSTHISNYQSSERESNKHDESDQMKFPCVLENALLTIRDCSGLSFAIKRIGPPCCTLCYYCYLSLVTNYLAIKLLVTDNFSACRKYLAENRLSFPSAPRWVCRIESMSRGGVIRLLDQIKT